MPLCDEKPRHTRPGDSQVKLGNQNANIQARESQRLFEFRQSNQDLGARKTAECSPPAVRLASLAGFLMLFGHRNRRPAPDAQVLKR